MTRSIPVQKKKRFKKILGQKTNGPLNRTSIVSFGPFLFLAKRKPFQKPNKKPTQKLKRLGRYEGLNSLSSLGFSLPPELSVFNPRWPSASPLLGMAMEHRTPSFLSHGRLSAFRISLSFSHPISPPSTPANVGRKTQMRGTSTLRRQQQRPPACRSAASEPKNAGCAPNAPLTRWRVTHTRRQSGGFRSSFGYFW